ncbi:MAG: hypothetical protein ACR2FO_07065 [Actinomycetota bacterium]
MEDSSVSQEPVQVEADAHPGATKAGDASLDQTLSCADVTNLDCDYVAKPDDSAEWAPRGEVSQQLLAQMTTHVGTHHPDRVLSEDEIEKIRKSISS